MRFFFAIIFLITIFFIPTSVVLFRDSSKKWGVFWVNLLVGWTGIGWIIALIWSFMSESETEKKLRLYSYKIKD
jgi:ABC-type transport system involved in cytochrome c biogenesis permease component